MALTVPSLPSLRHAREQVGNCLSVVTWLLSDVTCPLLQVCLRSGSAYRLASIWWVKLPTSVLLRVIGLSHVLFVCSTWTRKEAGHSCRRNDTRIVFADRVYNQRKRKRLTLIVTRAAISSEIHSQTFLLRRIPYNWPWISSLAGFEIVPIRVSETCQNISGHVKYPCMVIRRTCPFFATCN